MRMLPGLLGLFIPSPVDRGRCGGALFAMAAPEKRDDTERDLSAGFRSAAPQSKASRILPHSHRSVTVRARSHGTNCAIHPLSPAREGTYKNGQQTSGDLHDHLP